MRLQSPPKESIHFCRAEHSKLRVARWKVGSAAPPTFSLAPLDFEYLALPQVYTFFRWRLYSIPVCKKFSCNYYEIDAIGICVYTLNTTKFNSEFWVFLPTSCIWLCSTRDFVPKYDTDMHYLYSTIHMFYILHLLQVCRECTDWKWGFGY